MRESKFGGGVWRVGFCGALAIAVLAGAVGRAVADDGGSPPCGVVERARIVVKNVGAPSGDEELIFSGRLAFTAGALTDRLLDGAHVSIEGAGAAAPMLELTVGSPQSSRRARGSVRARAGDGAHAVLRMLDRRPRHDEVAFRLTAKGIAVSQAPTALRAEISLGSSDGATDKQCGTVAVLASDCRTDSTGTMLTCRASTDAAPGSHCQVSGCSAQVCAAQPVLTSCEWRPQYACYDGERCEDQGNGVCAWTLSEDLARCLAETSSPTPTPGPLEMSIPAAWQACRANSDCAVVNGLGCCGCDAGGGPEASLNAAYVDDFAALRVEHCSEVLCPGELLCREGVRAVCRQGTCTAVGGH